MNRLFQNQKVRRYVYRYAVCPEYGLKSGQKVIGFIVVLAV